MIDKAFGFPIGVEPNRKLNICSMSKIERFEDLEIWK